MLDGKGGYGDERDMKDIVTWMKLASSDCKYLMRSNDRRPGRNFDASDSVPFQSVRVNDKLCKAYPSYWIFGHWGES